MGVWKIQRELRQFDLCDGWFSLRYRHRVEHARIALRLVRAIQTRMAIRVQHDKHEDVDPRSCERISARGPARVSAACAGVETDRVDWRKLVALGSGGCHGVSIAGVFVSFAAIAWLARQQWFYHAFGFEYQGGFAAASIVPAMLLFTLLAGTISFWLSPFIHILSRRFEYEADAFARAAMGEAQSLIQALRKLSEKNLSNLTPHPLYSGFYYSHPTLLERERALRIVT